MHTHWRRNCGAVRDIKAQRWERVVSDPHYDSMEPRQSYALLFKGSRLGDMACHFTFNGHSCLQLAACVFGYLL